MHTDCKVEDATLYDAVVTLRTTTKQNAACVEKALRATCSDLDDGPDSAQIQGNSGTEVSNTILQQQDPKGGVRSSPPVACVSRSIMLASPTHEITIAECSWEERQCCTRLARPRLPRGLRGLWCSKARVVAIGGQCNPEADTIEHLHAHDCIQDLYAYTATAAGSGDLDVLRCLHEQGWPWDARVSAAAAAGGHLEVLQYLHSNGCPWDAQACALAAGNGHLEVLQYLHSSGCPCDGDAAACAAAGGHLHVLKFLHSAGCPWDESAYLRAASGGRLEMLRFLHEHGCPWDRCACDAAALGGHLDVLRYLYEHGCGWDLRAYINAASQGHIHILQFMHECGYTPRSTIPAAVAAGRGLMDVLRFLYAHGCPWDAGACTAAARHGHIEALRFLHSSGCPWDAGTCYAAGVRNRAAVHRYIHEHGCPRSRRCRYDTQCA